MRDENTVLMSYTKKCLHNTSKFVEEDDICIVKHSLFWFLQFWDTTTIQLLAFPYSIKLPPQSDDPACYPCFSKERKDQKSSCCSSDIHILKSQHFSRTSCFTNCKSMEICDCYNTCEDAYFSHPSLSKGKRPFYSVRSEERQSQTIKHSLAVRNQLTQWEMNKPFLPDARQ